MKGVNESKSLTKHTPCECKCKFSGRKCNSNQWWNNDKCWCECKKHHICEKDYIWNPSTCSCKNEKYLANIIDNSVITCDELIDADGEPYNEETKTIPKCFNEKKVSCKTQNLAVSMYCYLIRYQAKQKHLLQFHVTNKELRGIMY